MKVLLVVGALAACGGGQHGTVGSAAGFNPGRYIVEFPNARLSATRADGSPWHMTMPDNTAVVFGGVLGLAVGNPAIGMGIGKALSSPGGERLAPVPFIDLKIEAETYRISPVGPTYAPSWEQPVAIDARKRTGREKVIVQIRDAVDDSALAQYETTLGAFLATPAHTLTNIGAIMSLDVVSKPAPPRKRAVFHVTVPSTMQLDAMMKQPPSGWLPIPIWNGDLIEITATGRVCPSSPSECFGPEGAAPGRWTSYSVIAAAPHASLIAVAPDGPHHHDAGRTLVAASSGYLLLVVNDTDVGNNSGAFEVDVIVTPPN